jgi:ABC-type nitrate/sulfonate/bicarbonate transport system permease component
MKFGREVMLRISGLFVLAVLWQIAGHVNHSPALPPPGRVLHTLYYFIRDGTLTQHIFASLWIISIGIGVAVLGGFVLGLLMFRYRGIKVAVLPIIDILRGVAALTLFPLLIVLFGLGTFSRVFIIFWTAWPAVILSTLTSLQIDESVADAARTSGASEWRLIISIRIPMAAQGIFTGLRIGVGAGWISLVAAEMLGATRGLGYFLLWSAQSFQFERVYAAIIAIAAIGGVMNWILLFVQNKITKSLGVI